ncbi:putative dehydrogenase/aryl-alcohol dehydrogenase-like putative oxidoreductase [Friedmanniella endophytica]|uniref:Putative dehydrogenase/aryl-alcohol dehydrogenase-like putative oxidoreductase n=1 Tax=Microlunatus kandeliicorticis TaxID=1759536 RepID=A0A7W3ISE6_9ACTN|nr:aldo/keto reductase [Microlunatus kandeliicorticis]MBA8794360.1 putative dehydrogenase/aryl-alcohol dehydrogenase-like putative oxidoreductase [Microlunatus kandeliicorticis]
MTDTTPQHTSKPFGWAILGAGSIARRFASQLPGSGGRLVAVGSRDADRAAAWVADLPAEHREGEISTGDYDTVLADPAVDAVYVAAVHTAHAELTLRALAAGKHVLCEKPLAPNHGTAMAMVDAARQSGRVLVEAYMYRFHPQTAKLRELVAGGAIGDVTHVDASFAFDTGEHRTGRLFDPATAGGGILDVGGYPVSIARAVAGAVAGRAFAEPTDLTASGTVSGGVDHWAIAELAFPGGLTASVRTGVQLQDANTVTVYGSAGLIRLTDPWTLSADPQLVLQVAGRPDETFSFDGAKPYALEAAGLQDAAEQLGRGGSGDAAAMSTADSLGNAQVLDRWREAIGLRYPFETEDADIPPVLLSTLGGGSLSVDADAPMPYGEIDGVGKKISRLVMGVDNQPDLAHASAIFDHFFTRGGNTFDTGYIYGGGLLEGRLGRWIANRGVREDVVVITKGAHTPHCDPESITRQLLESLERQGTDYADIYLMHRDNPEVPVGEFVDVLDEHARAGRIRVFGGSNWSLERFDEANAYAAQNGKQGFAVLSNHFGLAEALDVPWAGCRHVTDRASKQWLRERQVPLFPWSSQARGFFTGRARPDDRSDAELVRCYYSDDNFERLARAEKLAAERGVEATAIALAFVLQQPFPTFPLFGPRTIAETRSSMAGLGVTLTPAELDWLDLVED